jgi:hypothetical protein
VKLANGTTFYTDDVTIYAVAETDAATYLNYAVSETTASTGDYLIYFKAGNNVVYAINVSESTELDGTALDALMTVYTAIKTEQDTPVTTGAQKAIDAANAITKITADNYEAAKAALKEVQDWEAKTTQITAKEATDLKTAEDALDKLISDYDDAADDLATAKSDAIDALAEYISGNALNAELGNMKAIEAAQAAAEDAITNATTEAEVDKALADGIIAVTLANGNDLSTALTNLATAMGSDADKAAVVSAAIDGSIDEDGKVAGLTGATVTKQADGSYVVEVGSDVNFAGGTGLGTLLASLQSGNSGHEAAGYTTQKLAPGTASKVYTHDSSNDSLAQFAADVNTIIGKAKTGETWEIILPLGTDNLVVTIKPAA